MNVLEAILGDGDGAKDDFDNEIANTTSMKRSKYFFVTMCVSKFLSSDYSLNLEPERNFYASIVIHRNHESAQYK